jgi:hypothetical protein
MSIVAAFSNTSASGVARNLLDPENALYKIEATLIVSEIGFGMSDFPLNPNMQYRLGRTVV